MQQKVPREGIWLDKEEWSSHPWANHHSQKHCLWCLGVCQPETFAAAFLIAQSVGVRAKNQRITVSVRTSRVLEFVLMHGMERAVMTNGVGRAKEHGDFILWVAWSWPAYYIVCICVVCMCGTCMCVCVCVNLCTQATGDVRCLSCPVILHPLYSLQTVSSLNLEVDCQPASVCHSPCLHLPTAQGRVMGCGLVVVKWNKPLSPQVVYGRGVLSQ